MNNPPGPASNAASPGAAVPPDAGEADLIRRSQGGDAAAFGDLVTIHRQRAFAMIYNMVRNEQDAWDLAQDGFLKAWRSIGRFRGDSAFFTWLYRILMNVTIDWVRRKRIESAGEFDDTIAPHGIDPAATTVPKGELAPAQRLSDREIRARIDAAMLKLSEEHREVIALRELDGLEYSEIAEIAGCSIGTVMSRLFYARKKLQTMLQDVYENL